MPARKKRRNSNAPSKPKRGRPSSYTKAVGQEICRRLSSGESLRRICRSSGMPSLGTVMRWLFPDNDTPELTQFQEQYARAREAQAEIWADEIVSISDESAASSDQVQRNRLRVDSRKWVAAKLLPKRYGERLDVTADVNTRTSPRTGGHQYMTDGELMSEIELARYIAFALENGAQANEELIRRAAAKEQAKPKALAYIPAEPPK